jgi:hypothetical protein
VQQLAEGGAAGHQEPVADLIGHGLVGCGGRGQVVEQPHGGGIGGIDGGAQEGAQVVVERSGVG